MLLASGGTNDFILRLMQRVPGLSRIKHPISEQTVLGITQSMMMLLDVSGSTIRICMECHWMK
jgi:hypothetical protein